MVNGDFGMEAEIPLSGINRRSSEVYNLNFLGAIFVAVE